MLDGVALGEHFHPDCRGKSVNLRSLSGAGIKEFWFQKGGESIPPWRQPRGKWMVSLVNSHTNATSKRWHLWEIDFRFALNSTPVWVVVEPSQLWCERCTMGQFQGGLVFELIDFYITQP